MNLSDRYKWEAEKKDGVIVSKGGDLRGCVRFSLIPQVKGLPRHDFTGIRLKRRFCRGFIKVELASKEDLPGLFFWENGSRVVRVDTDLTGALTVGDFIGKGVKGDAWYRVIDVQPDEIVLHWPYKGKTKADGFLGRKLIGAREQRRHYVHCIETARDRIWVNYETGAVLMTPPAYELYL